MNGLTLLLLVGFCFALALVGLFVWLARMQARHNEEGSYEYVHFIDGDVVYTGGFMQKEDRIPLQDIENVTFSIAWGRFRVLQKTHLGIMNIRLKSSAEPVEWKFESSLFYGHYVDRSTQRAINLTTGKLIQQFEAYGIPCEKDQSFIGLE